MGAPQSLAAVAPQPTSGSNFDACIKVILAAEGGFVNDPRDPGGATNRGITLRTLAAWRHHGATVDDVRALGVAEAAAIYRAQYWDPLRCDELPPGVALMVFDFGVNAGPARSARLLQTALGLAPDGAITASTLARAKAADPRQLIAALATQRLHYYQALPTFAAFGRGWVSRVALVKAKALALHG